MTRSSTEIHTAEIRTADRAAYDQAATTTACSFCPWTYTGTAIEGRARALEHRTRQHPEAKQTRRRRGHLQRWTDGDNDWRAEGLENAAGVAAMHAKRANAA